MFEIHNNASSDATVRPNETWLVFDTNHRIQQNAAAPRRGQLENVKIVGAHRDAGMQKASWL